MINKEGLKGLMFTSADNSAVHLRGAFVYALGRPVYSTPEKVSSGWTPFGCPGGWKKGDEYVAFSENPPNDLGQGIFFKSLSREDVMKDGVLYKRELIGWEEERMTSPIQSNFFGHLFVAEDSEWVPAAKIDFRLLRRRIEDGLRKYSAPDKENAFLRIAGMLNVKIS